MKNTIVLFLVLLLLLGTGCSEESMTTQSKITIEPTFSSLQANIFNNCAVPSCHGTAARGGLLLTSTESYAQLVNVRSLGDGKNSPPLFRVKPFLPDSSFLYIKITEPGKGQGDRMPQGGIPLTQTEVNAIRQWILDGAKNN